MKKQIYLFAIFVIFYSCQKNKSIIKKTEISTKVENGNHFYNYSLNSPENVIIILNGEKDTLITDNGIFPIQSEMDENRAYIYHLKYKGKIIGNYFEEFENVSKESVCLNSSVASKEECFDLVNISSDSLKKTPLSLTKKRFLEKYKIIN